MRADRLFSIVLMLQQHGRMTAGQLSERLEVSPRTILRDMEALSGAGIPVVADRGVKGGWSLLGDYRTDLSGLNEAEIQTLFFTKPTRVLSDLKLERAAEGATLKLLAALPSVYRRGAEQARQRIYIDPTGWSRSEEEVPMLPVLQTAVWEQERLQITYARHGCDALERAVDPLGLVSKGSAWYLVAAVAEEQVAEKEIRTYRVSRIVRAENAGEGFARPAGFDLAEFWEKSAKEFRAQLPAYVATVRVREEALFMIPYGGRFARVQQKGEVDEEGWARVTLRFDVEEMAVDYVLSFGNRIEVLDPESLREKVIAAAHEVIEFYEDYSRPTQTPIS